MGESFWRGLLDWFKNTLAEEGTISDEDLELVTVIDEPQEIVNAIFAHYETRSILPSADEEEIMLEL